MRLTPEEIEWANEEYGDQNDWPEIQTIKDAFKEAFSGQPQVEDGSDFQEVDAKDYLSLGGGKYIERPKNQYSKSKPFGAQAVLGKLYRNSKGEVISEEEYKKRFNRPQPEPKPVTPSAELSDLDKKVLEWGAEKYGEDEVDKKPLDQLRSEYNIANGNIADNAIMYQKYTENPSEGLYGTADYEKANPGSEINNKEEPQKASLTDPMGSTANQPASSTPPAANNVNPAASDPPTSGVSSDPKQTNSPYKIRSIMDAFNEGLIDKESRDYLIIDALSKGASSIGKIISNAGAAYTGGATVDPTMEKTLWDSRNEEMAKSAISKERADVKGSDYDIARQQNKAALENALLSNEKLSNQIIPSREMAKLANSKEIPAVLRGAAQAMSAKYAGANVQLADIVATALVQGGKQLTDDAEANGMTPEEYLVFMFKQFIPGVNIEVSDLMGLGLRKADASNNASGDYVMNPTMTADEHLDAIKSKFTSKLGFGK